MCISFFFELRKSQNSITLLVVNFKVKPEKTLTSPRSWSFPEFLENQHLKGVKAVNLTHRPSLSTEYITRIQIHYNCWRHLITVPTRFYLFGLLHFCRHLYMFRLLTPIIKSWYSCNYSFWYWSNGSATIRPRRWVWTEPDIEFQLNIRLIWNSEIFGFTFCSSKSNQPPSRMGTGSLSLRVKSAWGVALNTPPPPSSAEVKERVGLEFYSTQLTITRSCNYSCTSSWWWVSTHETCRDAYRNVMNWISRMLLGQWLNSIHDARTREYKICWRHSNMEGGLIYYRKLTIVCNAQKSL